MKLILVLVVIVQFSSGLTEDLKAEESGYSQPLSPPEESGYNQPLPPPVPSVPIRPAPKIHYTSFGTQQPTAYANTYGFHSSYNHQSKNVKNDDTDSKYRPAVRFNLGYAPAAIHNPLTYGQVAHKPLTPTHPATSAQPFISRGSVQQSTSKPFSISYAPPESLRPHYFVPGQHPGGAVVKTFLNRPSHGYSHSSLGYNDGDNKDEDNESKDDHQSGHFNRPLSNAAVPKRTYGYATVANTHAPANRYAYGHAHAPVYGQVLVPTYGYAQSPVYPHLSAAYLTSYDGDNENDKNNYSRAHGSYQVLAPVGGYVQQVPQH
ncbi:uncharacterized protein LOC143235539 [Tachypleus tridentatus]|uniref:uncharacterized protein LOC143235539 n=1 Tax=Tachypleus tridentatus TaxID=6853 RepID=UPI003FCEE903